MSVASPEVTHEVTSTPSTTEPPKVAHVVNCPMSKASTFEWVREAAEKGLEVTALCGYKWVPQGLADGLPPCPLCMEEMGRINREVFGE